MDSAYSEQWKALGLKAVSEAEGRDEHIRYGIFLDWILNRKLNPGEVKEVVPLIELEPDPNLQISFFILLIKAANDDALPLLLDIDEQRPFVEEEIALRRLDHKLNEEEQLQLAQIPSKKVQRKLLDKLPYFSVAELLQTEGVTRAVRNQAHALVRSRKSGFSNAEVSAGRPNKRMRHLFIILRIDRYEDVLTTDGITATKVFATESAADAEIQRLAALNPQSEYNVVLGREVQE